MMTNIRNLVPKGFALPTVLISSVVMLMVLLSSLTLTSAYSAALTAQYHDKLAQEASESGITLATYCIQKYNDTVTWTNEKPLKPGTDCYGNYVSGCSASTCFVVNTPLLRSTFTVPYPGNDSSGGYKLVANGSVSLLPASGSGQSRIVSQSSSGVNGYVNSPEIGGGAGWTENGHIGYFKTADGYLYGFGDNVNNQINDSSDALVKSAYRMNLPSGVTRVKNVLTSGQGASIICIIGQNDQLWCRGRPGTDDEPGLMASTSGWQKFIIPSQPNVAITSATISGQGGDTLCAITSSNEMYCAGENVPVYGVSTGGLFGNNTSTLYVSINNAVRFSTRSDYKESYNQDRYACGITTTDDMYCAGNNTTGTLGNNSTVTPPAGTVVKYPLPGSRKVAAVLSSYHSWSNLILHVLATDGTIWGSGKNVAGELGDGTTTARSTPVQFGTRTDYVAMINGSDHFCGITSGGDVYCAGNNNYGQIGAGVACSATSIKTPTKFVLPAGEKAITSLITQNRSSAYATIIQTQSGNIYSAGDNTYGRFGIGSTSTCVSTPVRMQLPVGTAKSVSTLDAYSTYVMTKAGLPFGTGRNNLGQLGDGTLTNRTSPQPIILPRQTIRY